MSVALHFLKPSPGSVHRRKRVGRGRSSGHGKTCGRGQKGAQSRSGYSRRPGFAGGNTPLLLTFPKVGFVPVRKKEYAVFNIGRLAYIADKHSSEEITPELLYRWGYIQHNEKVKILGDGELTTKKLKRVVAHAFSRLAEKKLKEAKIFVEKATTDNHR